VPGARLASAEAEFLASARRFAGPLRGVGLVVISAFGLLTVPEHALPLGAGLFGVIVVGATVDCWAGLTGRAAPVTLAFAVVRVVVVCVAQDWPGPWALHVLTITAITLQWEWSPTVAVPVTAGLLAVHLVAVGGAGAVVPRLVIECALSRLAFVLLRRSSARVDVLRERRAALARAEAVSLARRRREREYLALLHDTASSTFLLVAVRGADTEPARVAGYARHDLTVLTGGGQTAHDSPVDLTASLRTTVDRSPLTVDVRWRDAVLVPASVALALVRAVREALTNVERHAGVPAATLSTRTEGERVVVTVEDAGAGFRPDEVPHARRGIRGSVIERMTAVGGRADITSRPGAGTTVRLVWPDG
jgi:signal transduction histidine kinase